MKSFTDGEYLWGSAFNLKTLECSDQNAWDECAFIVLYENGDPDWESDSETDYDDEVDLHCHPGYVYPHGVFDSSINASESAIVDALRKEFEGQDLSNIEFGLQMVDGYNPDDPRFEETGETQSIGWRVMRRVLDE